MPKRQLFRDKQTKQVSLNWSKWARLALFLAILTMAQFFLSISWQPSDYYSIAGINFYAILHVLTNIFSFIILIPAIIVCLNIFSSRIISDSHWTIRFIRKIVPTLSLIRLTNWLYSVLAISSGGLGEANALALGLNMFVWLGHIYLTYLSYLSLTDFAIDRSSKNHQYLQDWLQWISAISFVQAFINFAPWPDVWITNNTNEQTMFIFHVGDFARIILTISLWKAFHHLPRSQRSK